MKFLAFLFTSLILQETSASIFAQNDEVKIERGTKAHHNAATMANNTATLQQTVRANAKAVRTTTTAMMMGEWVDSYGDNCEWYAAHDPDCSTFAGCCEKDGQTALTACAHCSSITTTAQTIIGAPATIAASSPVMDKQDRKKGSPKSSGSSGSSSKAPKSKGNKTKGSKTKSSTNDDALANTLSYVHYTNNNAAGLRKGSSKSSKTSKSSNSSSSNESSPSKSSGSGSSNKASKSTGGKTKSSTDDANTLSYDDGAGLRKGSSKSSKTSKTSKTSKSSSSNDSSPPPPMTAAPTQTQQESSLPSAAPTSTMLAGTSLPSMAPTALSTSAPSVSPTSSNDDDNVTSAPSTLPSANPSSSPVNGIGSTDAPTSSPSNGPTSVEVGTTAPTPTPSTGPTVTTGENSSPAPSIGSSSVGSGIGSVVGSVVNSAVGSSNGSARASSVGSKPAAAASKESFLSYFHDLITKTFDGQ